MQYEQKKNGVKLLAAVMVFAMAFAGAVVFFSDSDAEETSATEVSTAEEFKNAVEDRAENIVVKKGINLEGGDYTVKNLTVNGTVSLQKNAKLTVSDSIASSSPIAGGIQLDTGCELVCNGTITQASVLASTNSGFWFFDGAGKNAVTFYVNENMNVKGTLVGDPLLFGPIYVAEGDSANVQLSLYQISDPKYDYVLDVDGEISGTIDLTFGGKVIFGEKSSIGSKGLEFVNATKGLISGTINLDAGETVTIPEKVSFEGTVNGPSGNTMTGKFVAGTSGVTFTGGSLIINGDITSGEYDGVTVTVTGTAITISGTLNADVEMIIEKGTTVTIANSTVFTNNGTITVNGTLDNKGTLTNEKDLNVNGTLKNSNVINNMTADSVVEFSSTGKYDGEKITNETTEGEEKVKGTIKIPAGSDLTDIATGGSMTTSDGSDNFGMRGELEADYPVTKSAFLADDLTIPEGKTLTIKGVLDLKGHSLIVKGKLVIENKGSIVGGLSDVGTNCIVLSKTGVIENKGLIGANSYVKVTDEQDNLASVTMKNVTGVEFSLTKETTNYILTVSGNAAKKGTNSVFEIENAYISDLTVKDLEAGVTLNKASVVKNGSLNIGSKAIVSVGTKMTLLSGAVLTIDGKLTDGDVIMYLGSTANINGIVSSSFKAMTGDYATYDDADDGSRYNIDLGNYDGDDDIDYSVITPDNLKGFVIDITSKTYTDADENSRTVQMMNLSGQSAVADKDAEDTENEITVEREVYVAKGAELTISKDTTLVATGVIVTEGTLRIVEVNTGIDNYKGAEYVVKVTPETGSPYTDYIYTNFDSALTAIDSAENKTITLKGGYTFNKSFSVTAGQEIAFEDESAGYKIAKDVTVTIEADGEMSEGFALKGIMGTLVVKDGATCTPADGSYEVSSKDADDNYTYTSAASAIENAKSGETIYITSNVEFPENIAIPEGVTVDIANGQTVTAKKEMTVNGKILNNGNISVEQDLAVAGEIENEGNLEVTGTTTVTGKVVGNVKCDEINAASYNDDGKKVYTSVAKAIEAVSKMDSAEPIDVTGKVSENVDVALTEGMVLNIKGETVLKSIDMVVGSKVVISENGKLTTDIIGATGTESTIGALADTTVSVKALEATTFEMKKNESTSTTTMYMDATRTLKGTFTVTTGSVEILDAVAVSKDVVVKVASGAELVVKNNLSGEAKYFTNEGTVKVAGSMSITGLDLAGTVDVTKNVNLTVSDVTMTGAINTAEGATVKVADEDYMFIGSKPTTLGASTSVKADVTFGTGAYVVVFDGSSFENTSKTEMDSTAYTINGNAFATVFVTDGANVDILVVNSIVNGLKDLEIPYTDANDNKKLDLGEETYKWKSGSNVATTVGQYDSVDAKIDYAGVNVVISVGPGMIVYIDDLKVNADSKNLLIGEHTVTVYLEPDYTGTAAISFNGTTVSNGKIVVTADMIGKDPMLVVTGATPAEPTAPVTPGTSSGSDDGMGITDYLLIVLVVLIVIMAVLVAVRMMRS